TEADTHAALFITYDYESRKAEAATALDHFGHAVDVDDAFAKFVVVVEIFECHELVLRSLGQLRALLQQGHEHARGRGSHCDRRPPGQSNSWRRFERSKRQPSWPPRSCLPRSLHPSNRERE